MVGDERAAGGGDEADDGVSVRDADINEARCACGILLDAEFPSCERCGVIHPYDLIESLRDVLQRFSEHHRDCTAPVHPCTCGLDEDLKRVMGDR